MLDKLFGYLSPTTSPAPSTEEVMQSGTVPLTHANAPLYENPIFLGLLRRVEFLEDRVNDLHTKLASVQGRDQRSQTVVFQPPAPLSYG